MKKETTVALVLGIVCGVIIAFFLLFFARQKEISQKKVIAPQLTPTAAVSVETSLDIAEPKTGAAVTVNTITIKGTTSKNSVLVLQSPSSQKVLSVTDGSFSVPFPLSMGENVITVSSYTDKLIDDKTLKIYYLTP